MDNIKIVRLHNGEDIMAKYTEGDDETVLLDNPMQVIFKRIPTGQTVMMMMPWLPIEVIKENIATIFTSDILTTIEPKEDLIEYYGTAVLEAQQRMNEQRNFSELDDEEEDEEDDSEFDADEIFELLKERKNNKLH